MLIVLTFAWAYVQYGSTPQARDLLYGVLPVVVAIIIHALWGFLRQAVKGPFLAAVGIVALALYFIGVGVIPLLFGGAFFVLFAQSLRRWRGSEEGGVFVPLGLLALPSAAAVGPLGIFLSFLKIGAILFGSGYVLLAFLRPEFVDTGLLSDRQLLDAVAVGQITPGPVFTTATFIGYVLGGIPGAIAGTLGIFLPGFIFVAITGPIIPRLRESPILAGFLDGANVVSLALMAGVTWQLGRTAIVDPVSVLIAAATLILLFTTKLNPAWLVVGGGVVGLIARYLLG